MRFSIPTTLGFAGKDGDQTYAEALFNAAFLVSRELTARGVIATGEDIAWSISNIPARCRWNAHVSRLAPVSTYDGSAMSVRNSHSLQICLETPDEPRFDLDGSPAHRPAAFDYRQAAEYLIATMFGPSGDEQ